MNYWILIIGILSRVFINRLKKVDWKRKEQRFNEKHVFFTTQQIMSKAAWGMVRPMIGILDVIFRYLILGVIFYMINERTGLEGVVMFGFMLVAIKLQFLIEIRKRH